MYNIGIINNISLSV